MPNTFEFMRTDFKSSLFPLKLNLIMAQFQGNEISRYISEHLLKNNDSSFLPQQVVYATKPRGHLRRTVKLDPVAEYFIYDFIYRNRHIFRPEINSSRKSFGYRFRNGKKIPVHEAYTEYKNSLRQFSQKYNHNIQFDIASYFNSIYHHDLSNWFEQKDISKEDKLAISKYFREINTGKSIDFLPQGIYPCKMIGNEFLKFIDLTGTLKSAQIIRFMDDFTLFDNNKDILKQDFTTIQKTLGSYSLNINPSKTFYDNKTENIERKLSNIQQSLSEIVREHQLIQTPSGVEPIEIESIKELKLTTSQVEEIITLLKNDSIEESEADLILSFLRSHSNDLLELIPLLLSKFPNLIKHIHSVCSNITDKKSLTKIIYNYLHSESSFLEYQLFWLTTILEDYLQGEELYGESLIKIYELSSDYKISKAKVLEIPELNFGLKEIKNDNIRNGNSDWISWSSIMGLRDTPTQELNHTLTYFSKISKINLLITEAVKKYNKNK